MGQIAEWSPRPGDMSACSCDLAIRCSAPCLAQDAQGRARPARPARSSAARCSLLADDMAGLQRVRGNTARLSGRRGIKESADAIANQLAARTHGLVTYYVVRVRRSPASSQRVDSCVWTQRTVQPVATARISRPLHINRRPTSLPLRSHNPQSAAAPTSHPPPPTSPHALRHHHTNPRTPAPTAPSTCTTRQLVLAHHTIHHRLTVN